MSSPAISPELSTPADDASPPSILPLPLGNPVLPPVALPLPPLPAITPPFISPPAPPLIPPPAPLPAPISPAPSLPLIPTITPPPQTPIISPPSPTLISNPPAPALPVNPPPVPDLPTIPPAPAISKNPPATPIISTKPRPQQSPISSPATNPPKRTKFSHSSPSQASSPTHSKTTSLRGSKALPTTPPIPPPAEPAAAPAIQPVTSDDMPLTAEMPSPQPSAPLVVGGGGGSPAMAVLPVGANGSSDLRAGTAGGSGGGNPASVVSTGIIAGLCVGSVVLVALLVFGILLVFCKRKKKGSSFDNCGPCGDSFACNSKADLEGKVYTPSYTKRNTSFPDTEIWGGYNGGSGSTNSGSNMALPIPSTGTFTYEELVAATSGFSESNLLGQGGFGYVHKGVLPNGKEVAVKQLKMGGQQGEREFRAEVETISQVHHKHLVSLVGYCIAGAERLLVYEFVTNKTLEFHLHDKDQHVMDWGTRLKIAIGSAKGLAYLHEDCNPTIIHRDIKASNILLDFNYEAKLSDFGLAKIFSNANSAVTHITTRVMGTFGYLAPEYASSGKVTDKSDVYSYGVMLLELITGRPPINTSESSMNGSLVNWARPLLPQAIEQGNFDTLVDPRLQNNYNANEMANMVACAAACVRLSAWRRPRMSQVIRALEGDLSPSDLDDGVRPGHSSMHFPYESLDFDAQKYMEDMKKFKIALSSNTEVEHTTGRYSENTSEYGLQPSISSSDSHQSNPRSFELGRH